MKNVVIVTHKFVTHPDDELVQYLNNKKYLNVLHICHSFYEAPDRKSYYIWYKNGKIYKKAISKDYKGYVDPIIYLKELFYTFWWVIKSKVVWDEYIGMDGLCVLPGNILRKLGRVKTTVFWAIDFVPENRFPSKIATKIYHMVNIHGYKNTDEMWDLSPRMVDARQKYLAIKNSDYRKIKVVPYGMWTRKIYKVPYNMCDKETLVFMGRIIESQGVQLVVKALPQIIKRVPNFKFKIIGTGPYLQKLKFMIKKDKLEKSCLLLGKIEDHRILEKEIAKSALGIAPYINIEGSWTYYADPGKVKTYLACGVPVLTTDLPWNANEIEANKCGKIIKEDPKNIANAVIEFMNNKMNQRYRKNAIKYAEKFNYEVIFRNLQF